MLNASVPVWPSRSGRDGKVIAISGSPSEQIGGPRSPRPAAVGAVVVVAGIVVVVDVDVVVVVEVDVVVAVVVVVASARPDGVGHVEVVLGVSLVPGPSASMTRRTVWTTPSWGTATVSSRSVPKSSTWNTTAPSMKIVAMFVCCSS